MAAVSALRETSVIIAALIGDCCASRLHSTWQPFGHSVVVLQTAGS